MHGETVKNLIMLLLILCIGGYDAGASFSGLKLVQTYVKISWMPQIVDTYINTDSTTILEIYFFHFNEWK